MNPSAKLDVLVVGAGPVGLTMAAELARYGLRVRIIEKAPQRTDKSKALVLWSRTLELMARMGCAEAFIGIGLKAPGARITAGDELIAHVTFDSVATPYPYALMIPQSETERLMEEHLNSLGVKVERSIELMRFTDSGRGVTSTLRHADGKEETVESSWITGCDGAHSTVRHQLGMEFLGDTLQTDWILGDVHLSGVPNADEVNVMWHPEGVLAIFPITKDRYRVIADVGVATGTKRPDPTLSEVQQVLDRRGPRGIKATAPIWLAAFRINERKVADYQMGRVFVAGDAAHVHSPAGGQGMNTGMQDAFNLAWKLALVCRGVCAPEPLLESYSTERSAVGDQVLKSAGHLTSIAIMRGEVKQAIRNHIASVVFGFAPVRHAMADAMSEISIGYPQSPLTAQGPGLHTGPHAGERAPIRAGEPPVGAGGTPRFVLFAARDDRAAAFVAEHPDLVEQGVRAPFHGGGMWLVRPDGYIAVTTRHNDWDRLATFLGTLKPHG